MPSFLKGKSKQKSRQDRSGKVLEINQRVVTFIGDHPARGTVRCIVEEKDSSGNWQTIVGLEMVSNPWWDLCTVLSIYMLVRCICRHIFILLWTEKRKLILFFLFSEE